MYPYEKLRAPNVLSTLAAIDLAAIPGNPKSLIFISSTAVLECAHYVQLSDQLSRSGNGGVPEDDDLEGARTSLKSGYGQTKWVSEKLLREAGKRGLGGYIVRPGYVVGDSQSAGMPVSSIDYLKFTDVTSSHQHRRFHLAIGEGLYSTRARP